MLPRSAPGRAYGKVASQPTVEGCPPVQLDQRPVLLGPCPSRPSRRVPAVPGLLVLVLVACGGQEDRPVGAGAEEKADLENLWEMESLPDDPFDSVIMEFLPESLLQVRMESEVDLDELLPSEEADWEEFPSDLDFNFGTGRVAVLLVANWTATSDLLTIRYERVGEIRVDDLLLADFFGSLGGTLGNEQLVSDDFLLGILIATIEQAVADRAASLTPVFGSVSYEIEGQGLTIHAEGRSRRFNRLVRARIVGSGQMTG